MAIGPIVYVRPDSLGRSPSNRIRFADISVVISTGRSSPAGTVNSTRRSASTVRFRWWASGSRASRSDAVGPFSSSTSV